MTVVPKLSRQEIKERHAFARHLRTSLKERARGTGWGCAQGFLFREHQGWFVEIRPTVALNGSKAHLRLHVKPMGVDPIFWQIVQLPDNIRLPLVFRASGAWICHTYPAAETILPRAGHQAERLVTLVIKWADEQLAEGSRHWRLEGFIADLQAANNDWNFSSLIGALVLAGRKEEALSACRDAKTRGKGGTFFIGTESFVDLALKYLSDNQSALTTART